MNVRTIFSSLILLFTLALAAWAQDETIDFSEQGFTNAETVYEVSGGGCRVTFNIGENTHGAYPKYYDNGEAVRLYVNNTMTVTSTNGKSIAQINIVFGSGDGRNNIVVDGGTYADGTWVGNANEVVFSCAQSGSFFIGGYDELFWATEQSIVQLVNHNKRVV